MRGARGHLPLSGGVLRWRLCGPRRVQDQEGEGEAEAVQVASGGWKLAGQCEVAGVGGLIAVTPATRAGAWTSPGAVAFTTGATAPT